MAISGHPRFHGPPLGDGQFPSFGIPRQRDLQQTILQGNELYGFAIPVRLVISARLQARQYAEFATMAARRSEPGSHLPPMPVEPAIFHPDIKTAGQPAGRIKRGKP